MEDLKKGQLEVNFHKRNMPYRSWRVTSTDYVKVIRLIS